MSSNLHVFLQTRSGFEEFEHIQVLGLEPLQCRFGSMLRVIVLLEGKPSCKSFADWNRFSYRIVMYSVPSVLLIL